MNEYKLRLQVLASDLKPNEKVIMFAIIMKVDWNTFKRQVSASQLVEMTGFSLPTVKRILSQLTKKSWIKRTSRHIGPERSTAAYTEVLFDNVNIDTRIKTDTVSDLSRIKVDTPNRIKTDTHTIVTINNNNNQSSNSLVTSKWKSLDRDDNGFTEEPEEEEREIKKVYKFYLNSSIKDPEERERVERHVLKNSHRLSHMDKERLLHPELTKPLV